MTTTDKPTVGWIGLGAMGSGMAASLLEQGYPVQAYDVWAPSLEAVAKAGARPCATPAEAAKGAKIVSLMVVNAAQVEDVLFGAGQVASVLEPGSAVICFSTVPPSFLASVTERLAQRGIGLCDSPVSGGSSRALAGTLTVMTSGTAESIKTASPVLDGLTRKPDGNHSIVGDTCGDASSFKLINQVFCAIQIASASEGMTFGAKLGLNPRMLYNIIKTGTGNSFMFGHRVPLQLRYDGVPRSAMSIIAKDSGIVNDEARLLGFPAPLSATVEQLFASAMGAGMAREEDGRLTKFFEKFGGPVIDETGTEDEEIAKAKELDVSPSGSPRKVLFVGLGVMGAPMALAVQRASIAVVGFDVSLPAMDRYAASGGQVESDIARAASDADVVVMIPNTAEQAEAVLFGANGTANLLPANATIIISSTIAPSSAVAIQSRLDQLNKGLQLVDAPVAGGPSRSEKGDLTVFASGSDAGLASACTVLQALSTAGGSKSNLHFIPGGVGSGCKVKAVNNLLACIHIAAAAEALAFAKRKDMDLDAVMRVISSGAAYSYVAVDREPRMRMANPPVHSALDTLVKDLKIVLTEAKKHSLSLFLGATTYQQFVAAQASGLGKEDDSAIVRLWEPYGIRVRAEA